MNVFKRNLLLHLMPLLHKTYYLLFYSRYLLAENLDSQIKQMSEDLKEIIEHLNEVNKVYDPNDPVSL